MPLATVVGSARSRVSPKHYRYMAVSVIAVVFSQVVLITCSGPLGVSPVWSNVIAVSIGCIPSYLLNRYWTWGKRGRNHFWKEVMPFWVIALFGLLLSTVMVAIVSGWTESVLAISATNLFAFGILWIVKFFILNSILFAVADEMATG